MTRPWGSLPAEIIQIVLKNLRNPNDVDFPYDYNDRQCQLISKGWLIPAQQKLFETVYLDDHNNASAFLDGIQDSPNYVGDYVRSLHLGFHQYPQHWASIESDFSRLVESCRNVKSLAIDEMLDTMWLILLEALEKGKWKNLEFIPAPNDISDIEYYTKTALVCDKLETLTLFLWDGLSTENEDSLKKLTHGLNYFKYLKKLDIKTVAILQNLFDLESMVVMDHCPSLESVSVKASYALVIERSPYQPDFEDKLALVHPHFNIKTFWGFIQMSDESLQYLMHKFPNISTLTINEEVYHNSMTVMPMFSVREDVLSNFFDYISKMKYFNINFCVGTDATELISSYFKATKNPPTTVKIHFNCKHVSRQVDRPITNICNDPTAKQNSVNHWQDDSNMIEISFLLPAHYEERVERFPSLWLHNIENNIKELHLSASRNNRHVWPVYEDSIYSLVQQVARFCTSLKTLTLTGIELGKQSDEDRLETVNQSLETLILQSCPLDSDTLYEASHFFPLLKNVIITVDKAAVCDIRDAVVIVDMPFTSIETLTWDDKLQFYPRGCSKIYLKASSVANGQNYFVLDDASGASESSSEDEFKNSKTSYNKEDDDTTTTTTTCCTSIHIICKSIKLFVKEYNSSCIYSPKTYILNQ